MLKLDYSTSLLKKLACMMHDFSKVLHLLCFSVLVLFPLSVKGQADLVTALRERLFEAAQGMGQAKARTPVQCRCEDYCTGRCFAPGCASCPADTWSFPHGADMCYDAGPLGTGLLCRVDSDGKVTQSACCGQGMPCELPAGSCCESGGCSKCPKYKPQDLIFSRLDESNPDPRLRRHFDPSSNKCTE